METSVVTNRTIVVQSCKQFCPMPLLCKRHCSVVLSSKAKSTFVCEQTRLLCLWEHLLSISAAQLITRSISFSFQASVLRAFQEKTGFSQKNPWLLNYTLGPKHVNVRALCAIAARSFWDEGTNVQINIFLAWVFISYNIILPPLLFSFCLIQLLL